MSDGGQIVSSSSRIFRDFISGGTLVSYDRRPIYVLVLKVDRPVDREGKNGGAEAHEGHDGGDEVRGAGLGCDYLAVGAIPLDEFLKEHNLAHLGPEARDDGDGHEKPRGLDEPSAGRSGDGCAKSNRDGEGSRGDGYHVVSYPAKRRQPLARKLLDLINRAFGFRVHTPAHRASFQAKKQAREDRP